MSSHSLDMHSSTQASIQAGHQAYQQQQWEQASALYQQALTQDPSLEVIWLQQARCLVHLGQQFAAREAFATTLRLNSTNYSAWLEAGHLCRLMGQPQQAQAAYQKAIDMAPNRFEALLGMARLKAHHGHYDEAEQAYQQALRTVQGSNTQGQASDTLILVARHMGQYWLEVGQAHRAQTTLSFALQHMQAAHKNMNEQSEVLIDLATASLQLGQLPTAHQVLGLASNATDLNTLVKLAQVSLQFNFGSESVQVMERATQLHPQSTTAWSNLSYAQAQNLQLQAAQKSLEHALTLGPVDNELSIRTSILSKLGDPQAILENYIQLAEQERQQHPQGQPGPMASSAAMSSLYCDHLSPLEVAQLHHDLFIGMTAAGARTSQSFKRQPLEGRRLRVGLVTADMHYQHPVNIFMQPLLRELNKQRIELFLYYTNTSKDSQAQLAQSRVEHWHDVPSLNNAELARRIDDHQIDVLVDLSGHTRHNRMALFAQRAAPVQVTYLGYPGSTGVPNIDYLLADAVVAPANNDTLFSEHVLRFSGSVFCYAPEEHYPLPQWTEAMATRPLTFGSFNNSTKLTQRTLKLWARVLQAVPHSRLVLKAPSFADAGAQALFAHQFSNLGVDAARIEFRGPVGLPQMMAEYADIDIALDPTPYNGGTTSLQALWMGVPVLTLHGQQFVERMGASFMQAAGLPEWVATSEDDYVDIAQRMASDRHALLNLKKGLRTRLLNQPAWDAVRHTRELEDLLLQAALT